MNIDDKIRSLTRNEIKVLYWKCRGQQYGEIAIRYDRSLKWVQGLMTSVYRKLEVKKGLYPPELWEYLRTEVCPIVQQLIGEDEDNLERWPLYGMKVVGQVGESTIYEENQEKGPEVPPDLDMLAIVLFETDEDGKPPPPPPEPSPIKIRTPKELPSPTLEDRQRIFGVIGLVLFVIFLGYIFSRSQNQVSNREPTEEATQVPTDLPTDSPIIQALTAQADATELPTRAPTPTKTPTIAPSPTLAPTAIPLPIREDFTNQYSDLWITMGDVFIGTGSSFNDYPGVLTTNFEENGSIQIGNTSWTDYIVSMRAAHLYLYTNLILGVRVKDRNNMVGLECDTYDCTWFVIHKGVKEELGGDQSMKMIRKFTLTVEGNRFAAIGTYEQDNMLLVLPPKYAGQFPGGGIYLEISGVEVDFIEISPFQ